MQKLLIENAKVFGVVCVMLPFLFWCAPRIPARYGFAVSIFFFAIAGYFLHDFGVKAAGSSGVPSESIGLLDAYGGGVRHTLRYFMWPLALNFCFAVAFGALMTQSKGFAPVPMAVWLMMALLVSVVLSLRAKGIGGMLAAMTPELWFGFLAAIVACVCFQVHSMRH